MRWVHGRVTPGCRGVGGRRASETSPVCFPATLPLRAHCEGYPGGRRGASGSGDGLSWLPWQP